jgi:hypothetical protein
LRAWLVAATLLWAWLVTATLLWAWLIAVLTRRIVAALLRARLIGRAISLLLRAAAVVLRNGMRFIATACRFLWRFLRGLRLWQFLLLRWLRGGCFLRRLFGSLVCNRCFGGVRLRVCAHSGRFRRNNSYLLHQIVVISPTCMRSMILIGVEHFAQSLHALALFTRLAHLLLFIHQFAFRMAHGDKQLSYGALRQRKPLQKLFCDLLNPVCRFEKIVFCHLRRYPRVFCSPLCLHHGCAIVSFLLLLSALLHLV